MMMPMRQLVGFARAGSLEFLGFGHAGKLHCVGFLPTVAVVGTNSEIKVGESMSESSIPT